MYPLKQRCISRLRDSNKTMSFLRKRESRGLSGWLLLECLSLLLIVPGSILRGDQTASVKLYDPREYGASADGTTLDTKNIQAAIDDCHQAGGGIVGLHNGKFLSGTIFLKNNVVLNIQSGATLLGSKNLKDYPETVADYRSYTDNYTNKSLIYAEKAENISVIGRGVIDGQGKAFKGPYKVRPYLIRIIECKNVTFRDVTLRNSPMWGLHYLACENVVTDGVTIHSRVNHNNDGIDIDSSQNVRIANCNISSGDDAIVLKSTSDLPCKNITITNCVLSSHCNAIKTGTESNGGFQNITISNCTLYDTRLAGIALELVDGGLFDRVTVSNINMDNVRGGIFLRLGNRARPYLSKGPGGSKGTFTPLAGAKPPGMGAMRNIIIANVQAAGLDSTGCSITGLPGHNIQNLTLQNIRLQFAGGGSADLVDKIVPENENKYPEYRMFGDLPAYGFYVRHAENIRFNHVEVSFDKPDHRPALVCDDIKELKLFDFDAQSTSQTKSLIILKNTDGDLIHACRPQKTETAFLYVEGEKTKNISLINNDLRRVKTILQKTKDLPETAVQILHNLMP